MAAGLGIAAGAFAQNYAQAMGLRSRLDAEKQQQELTAINLQRQRDFDAAQKEMAALHTNFQNKDFDFVNNRPYEPVPEGGITPPGAARPANPYADPDRVNAYYDRMAPQLERQAFAAGKGSEILGIRKTIEGLRKERYMERLGESLALIEAGDERGFGQLAGVYNSYPDGRKLKSGSFNQDGTINLVYVDKDGNEKQQTTSFDKLSSMAKSALNLADTVKLREAERQAKLEREFRSGEGQKDRDFRSGEGQKDRDFRSGEGQKDRDFRSSEGQKDRDFRSGEGEKDRTFRAGEGEKDRTFRATEGAADRSSRERTVNAQIEADRPTRDLRARQADAEREAADQKYFQTRFQVDAKFAPKPESEVKNLFGDAKKAYERDLERWNNATKLSRSATNIAAANPGVPKAKIAEITERLNNSQMEVFTEDGSRRRFVNASGKRIYLD